eukprot:288668-Amorphochlora_amoeboformis.AAC.1
MFALLAGLGDIVEGYIANFTFEGCGLELCDLGRLLVGFLPCLESVETTEHLFSFKVIVDILVYRVALAYSL